MAISAPSKSAQYLLYSPAAGTPTSLQDGRDLSGLKLAYCKLTFTAAGFTTASAGDIGLIRMPAGKIRIYPDLSGVQCPIGTATSDFDMGYAAYTKRDGTTQTADQDAWVNSGDVGAAALTGTWLSVNGAVTTAAIRIIEVESKSGWDLVCSFDTANSPAAGDLIVWAAFTHDSVGS